MAKIDLAVDTSAANPLHEEIEFRTLRGVFEGVGQESRKQKWLYPKRNVTLQYNYITVAEARTLWEFYKARKGSYEQFSLFWPWSNVYTDEYIGTGDGTTTVFNTPGKTISSYTVYQNGASLTETTEYTISATGGTDGEAQLTLITAAPAGERLTIDFTGYLKIRCRFNEDILTFDTFYNLLVSFGVKLKGDLNA